MLTASCLVLLLQLCAATADTYRTPSTFQNRKQNYVVVASRQYRPGQPYLVAANLLSPGSASIASAQAELRCPGRAGPAPVPRDSWTAAASSGATRAVTLTLRTRSAVPRRWPPHARCELRVAITDTNGRSFSKTGRVGVDPVEVFTYVETDKAVYKPGQTVKFRVVSVNEMRRPIVANATVVIKDAAGNLVDKQQHVVQQGQNLSAAVLQGEFPLSSQPNLGQWSILASTDFGSETKHFEVDKYVLPKFDVELRLPEFVQVDEASFTLRAEPRYTHAQPAHGVMRLTASLPYRCRTGYGVCRFNQTAAADDGASQFTFSLRDWHRLPGSAFSEHRYGDMGFGHITAEFTEKFTGIKRSVTKRLVLFSGNYFVRLDFRSPYYVPGMRLRAQVRLVRDDHETPFALRGGSLPLRLTATAPRYGYGPRETVELYSGRISTETVTVPFTLPMDGKFVTRIFLNAIVGYRQAPNFLIPMDTAGGGHVTAQLQRSGRSVLATVSRTEGVTDLHYAIQHSGMLTAWAPISFGDSSNEANVSLSSDRLQQLGSEFAFLAVGFHGNELLAASDKMDVDEAFSNVQLSANASAVQPQSVVKVQVSSLAHSLVYMTGIDHSVNLISSGQSISPADIRKSGSEAPCDYINEPSQWSAAIATQSAGLLVLTDFMMRGSDYHVPCTRYEPLMARPGQVVMAEMADSREAAAGAAAAPAARPPAKVVKKLQVRKFFPESFIWTTLLTNGSGHAEVNVRMPDTITSWSITAFAVGADAALQAAPQPLQVVTSKKFFVRPVFPYSLVRGESLLLKVLVFNHHTEQFSANVSLSPDPTIRVFAVASANGSATWQQVAVAAGGTGVVVFRLRPLQLPAANVTVRGVAEYVAAGARVVDTDVVVRQVAVRPEGQTQYRTQSVLLNVSGSAEAWLLPEFPSGDSLSAGQRLVAGSEFAQLQVVGDMMGPALSNLQRLLRMPYGCGEQNMVNFAPAAAVLKYLRSTGQERPDSTARALLVMKTGYQRELTYKRSDGSYSAFGNSDPAGSTWLTAFVLSVYAQAAEFIAIDPEAMCGRSVAFLLGAQRRDGLWAEPPGGRVIHKAMQGASGAAGVSITAYTCAALAQVRRACRGTASFSRHPAFDRQLRRGLEVLYRRYSRQPGAFASNDLALTAFAATTPAGRNVAAFAWRQLLRQSQEPQPRQRMWLGPSGSGSVETSGYALLAALRRPGIEVQLQVVRWLVQQQNSLGGYGSTQDTVVGLQAMAAFAARLARSSGQLQLAATWPGGQCNFSVTPANRVLLQSHVIGRGAAARTGRLRLAANGSGLLLATVAWQYNVADPPAAFISADWQRAAQFRLRLGHQSLGATFRLQVCAAPAPAAGDGVGMHILSLHHPSGFAVASHSKPGDPSRLQLVEAAADAVVFYLSELSSEVCVFAEWSPSVPVLDLKPQRISVQNYYEPEKEGTLFHLHPGLAGRTACSACPDCPQCRGSEL